MELQGYGVLRLPEFLLVPPALPLVLVAGGQWQRWRTMTTLALLLFYLACIPATIHFLYRYLETYPPLNPRSLPSAQAIVVLGTSRYRERL